MLVQRLRRRWWVNRLHSLFGKTVASNDLIEANNLVENRLRRLIDVNVLLQQHRFLDLIELELHLWIVTVTERPSVPV
jgi:hypothetical protein